MLLDHLQAADIIIGIPSYNEDDTIPYVTQQVDLGLNKYFPDKNCVICNIDNSPDNKTKKAFLETNTKASKLFFSTKDLGMGKGANIRLLFEIQDKLNCPTTVMVDSDLKSITPEWIRDLATPITKGFDFVTPMYVRNHLDGTITNNIVYPLVYGLLGKDLRQPIGGEFAFSLKLTRHWLEQDWKESTYFYGIDNFMSINALTGDFKVCQVNLGAKIHKPSAPKLNEMFTQVTNTLFSIIAKASYSLESKEVSEITTFGKQQGQPQALVVDKEVIKTAMMTHWEKSREFLSHCLAKGRFSELDEGFAKKQVYINDSLWTELVYTLLAYYIRNDDGDVRAHVIEALKPLYFARIMSYIKETEKLTEEQAEALIKHQAKVFREQKDYFFELIKHKITPQHNI